MTANSQTSEKYQLYPPIIPRQTFHMPVGDGHQLYVEELGNPDGIPVVFLHGGPGGCVSPTHRRLFDPERYRIILFDQRGAGQSIPNAGDTLDGLKHNTTWDLISDLEKIRQHFGIQKWLVFGGSWGSTLALAYAQAHSEFVSGLILRGIFLCTDEELAWFYQGPGVSWLFPDLWERYVAPIPATERSDMIGAYHRRLTGTDEKEALACARAWSQWEAATCHLLIDEAAIAEMEDAKKALGFARIECHYFKNQAFLTPRQLLEETGKIAHIPTIIIHGRYDVICPVQNAWELKKRLPNARLEIIPDAGHAFSEPGILSALLRAQDDFAKELVTVVEV